VSHLAPFFLSSRFTDCAAGEWPACAVELRYDHCTDGGWSFRRLTPTAGADITSVGRYVVTGALARTDGSWGIEYLSELAGGSTSFYSWDVAADGRVTGRYWAPGAAPPEPPTELLGPFVHRKLVACG
jgi:hypothetical protein